MLADLQHPDLDDNSDFIRLNEAAPPIPAAAPAPPAPPAPPKP